MERLNLSELKQQKAMGKRNQDLFALTFGTQQIPPYAQTMSKKKKRLKYKEYQRSLQSSWDRALQLMSIEIEGSLPSISDLINSPSSKYITLAANDCGYDGTAEEVIVSYVHPLFCVLIWLQASWTTLVGARLPGGNLPMTTGKPWSSKYHFGIHWSMEGSWSGRRYEHHKLYLGI